ncbi:hypothetical protein GCM10023205_04170 [Yinghuangia aomiensis]|uniref:Transposase n=1 Tax=Yinghuangia aomiensis TaxID=676205 RepID=A0ABP9GM71_9ACTN
MSSALAEAGTHYATADNPFHQEQPSVAVGERRHRHLAHSHRILTHTIVELRDATADYGYTYPRPRKRVRGITPVTLDKSPTKPTAGAARATAPRLI